MSKRELYIAGKKIELDDREKIVLSFQNNDIAELADRFGDFSYQFFVPATESNRQALSFSDQIATDSRMPYRKLDCIYIEDGTYLITKGYAIIESYQDGFSININSGIFDLFDLIGEKTLRDLDWSELDHEYTLDAINFVIADDIGVQWPLADWGVYSPTEPVDIRYQRPTVYFSYIIEKIFDYVGYEYSGEILNDSLYQALAITLNADDLVNSEEVKAANSAKLIARDNTATFVQVDLRGILNFHGFDFCKFATDSNGVAQEGSNIGADFVLSDTNYFSPIDQAMDITVKFFFQGKLAITIYKNGKLVGSGSQINNAGQIAPLTVTAMGLPLRAGDRINIIGAARIPDNTIVYQQFGNEWSFIQFQSDNPSEYGGTIHYNSVIPEIPIKDFLRNFANIFALTYHVTGPKQIKFTTFKEIKTNISEGDDWSDRLDLSHPYQIEYRIGKYTQINYLNYKPDNTNGVGDSQFQIDDTTLDPESTLLQLIFSGSLPYENIRATSHRNNNRGISIQRYTLLDEPEYRPYNEYNIDDLVTYAGQIWIAIDDVTFEEYPGLNPAKWDLYVFQYEQTVRTNTRLVLIRPLSDNVSDTIDYTDGVVTDNYLSTIVKLAYFSSPYDEDQLPWSFLLEKYYSEIQDMLTKAKVVTCRMRLSKNDIVNLDFTKPKYISYFGGQFYLNKVSEYIDGFSSECQFLRI